MAPRLIINADDFGLTPGVNRAIAELHQAGALTSATLMATGPAFDDAVAIAHANPTLGVGCHIVLTDGVPVSPPESIPTLIGPDGKTFRPSLIDFLQALLRGTSAKKTSPAKPPPRYKSSSAPASTSLTSTPTNTPISSPPSPARSSTSPNAAPSAPSATPSSSPGASRSATATAFAAFRSNSSAALKTRFERQPQIRNAHVLTTDGTIGISATGDLYGETLHEILHAMPAEGTFELCCHPGYNDRDLDRITTRLRAHRDIERNALLTEIPAIALHPNAPQLINYGNLGSLRRSSRSRSVHTRHRVESVL